MTALVIDLDVERDERRERPSENRIRPRGHQPIHGWDANAVVSICIDETFPPAVANVRWLIRIDPLRRTWEVGVFREGWEPLRVFQGGDNAALILLNELLSASYGVSA